MMQKLCYDFKSIRDARFKLDAATELFGTDRVTAHLSGTWKDETGDAVFFDIADSAPIDHISTEHIYVDVDGEMTGVTGVEGASSYKLVVR